ncbi:MAG: 3-oxoacyl-ACP synthase III family protein [Candidatus Cyclobacteriaceae bacterium M2_1C_046]
MKTTRSVITGTGSYIPEVIKKNTDFNNIDFYSEKQEKIPSSAEHIIKKFQQITGIEERRYIPDELDSSTIGAEAAKKAIEDSGVDPEQIDQLIVAHNFGDVKKGTIQTDILPSIASRIKQLVGINNPACVAYDILFGCPGWLQGVIQADAFIKSGMSNKCLVVGTETLSRVLDPYDRDSMIFSDGAGACIIEKKEVGEDGPGILGSAALTHTAEEAYYLFLGKSNLPESDPNVRYIKMNGRKVYEYAISKVPQAMAACLEKSNVSIKEVKKVFIHQANEKLDEGIINRFFEIYNEPLPDKIMPMSIHKLGNSSVATIPTLYDMVKNNLVDGHQINEGDVVIMASVGAGMNINAICYRI